LLFLYLCPALLLRWERYLPPPKTPHSKRNTANYFIQLPTTLHHFQAHRKRAKRQQHFCEELERFLYSALLMHLNTQYFKKQNIFTNFAPMKLFWLIFSFYILALAAIPCCESDKCVKEINTTISQNPNHNQHQSELCTPFCSCALCPASAFYETINLIKFRERNISFEREIQVSLYSFIYTKEFSSTIWQPPKLG
jgi:hypothetical protein